MRIAIIGSGISGLTAAWLLNESHEITVFEANDYIGGHTHTVSVEGQSGHFDIDTGFIVFNDWTYPNFIGLLETLDVATQPTTMGFSVRCDRSGIEYSGSDLNGLFSQRKNFLRLRFYKFILDILKFNREAPKFRTGDEKETVGVFLRKHGYSKEFAQWYLLPMGAAIWSCPMETFEEFPVRFIIEFYINHGLLRITGRPTWRTIVGGSHSYVKKLTSSFQDRIRLSSPVESVVRKEDEVEIRSQGQLETFDEVVFACHSDQALRLLGDADSQERSVLECFPYSKNTATLHTDTSTLPSKQRAWASWNYHVREDEEARPTVTYNMNMLQNLQSTDVFCVTLNEERDIPPSKTLGSYNYSHPVFTIDRARAQRKHSTFIRRKRTSFCGAYWGNGFHEDGVVSALAVCRKYGILPPWETTSRRASDLETSPQPVNAR